MKNSETYSKQPKTRVGSCWLYFVTLVLLAGSFLLYLATRALVDVIEPYVNSGGWGSQSVNWIEQLLFWPSLMITLLALIVWLFLLIKQRQPPGSWSWIHWLGFMGLASIGLGIIKYVVLLSMIFGLFPLPPAAVNLICQERASRIDPNFRAQKYGVDVPYDMPTIQQKTTLDFYRLKSVTAPIAENIRRCATKLSVGIDLSGLETLSPEVATILIANDDTLHLNGLSALSVETANVLARYRGKKLDLYGLRNLPDEAAFALAQNPGVFVAYELILSESALRRICPTQKASDTFSLQCTK